MRNRVNRTVCIILTATLSCLAAFAQDYNIAPPEDPVNLLWIHHSTGANFAHRYGWSQTWNDGVAATVEADNDYARRHNTSGEGGNGEIALYNNNYIMHHLSYGSQLADGDIYTDYRDWYYKFRNYLDSGDTAHYAGGVGGADLVHCYSQDITYAAQGTDEFTGEDVSSQTNQVIMFKSCFPNSYVYAPDTSGGLPANPTITDARAWISGGGYETWRTSGESGGPINFIQAEYLALLDVFGEERYRDILFVAWVAPPMLQGDYGDPPAYARALSEWFEDDWLDGYAYQNVMAFNYWNIHTGEHDPGDGSTLPALLTKHNHCRYNPFTNSRDYTAPGDPDFVDDIYMCFSAGDSHPNHFGGAVAAKELVPLLNIQWNRLHDIAASDSTGYPADGRTGFFMLDSTYTGALPAGVSHGILDGVECLIFDGSVNATLDLDEVDVAGTGGAFSYCYWYHPNDNSATIGGDCTVVLSKEGVFSSDHYAEDDMDSHINTYFGEDYPVPEDHTNAVVDNDNWTHVAFVWDGSASRHYISGVQIVETVELTRTVTDNTNHLILGPNSAAPLNGGIREVAIYNRALTADEVRCIFQANAGDAPPEQIFIRTAANQWDLLE
ncbi:LamG domain-containing protein [Candidatus Sumerlaeota bacterium]|nr:LamG domain-containing protein [Candidatus Sumerlaeota bacterium]